MLSEGAVFSFEMKWLASGTRHCISAEVWMSRNLSLKGIYQGLFAHFKCFFIHHMAMFWLLCFQEVTKLTGSRRKIVRLWTFLSEYKTLSNSTEIYNLVKDSSCKHVPYSPLRKTENCTMKANSVCRLSEFLGTAMYREGQWAVDETPGLIWPRLIVLKI